MNKSNSDIRISPCLAACKNSENISATLWTHIFLILRILQRLKIHRDLVSRRIITGIEFSRYQFGCILHLCNMHLLARNFARTHILPTIDAINSLAV